MQRRKLEPVKLIPKYQSEARRPLLMKAFDPKVQRYIEGMSDRGVLSPGLLLMPLLKLP